MAEFRVYQAWVTTGPDVERPEWRVYQAYGQVPEPAPPATWRIYQAWATTAASGVGTWRLYQAQVDAALPEDVVLSGVRVRRGGNLAGLTLRAHRNGSL